MKSNQLSDNSMQNQKKCFNGGVVGVIVFAVIIIGAILLFAQGSTTTTGSYPDNVSDDSLTCTGENINYSFFTYDNATKKSMEIDAIFSKNELKSIALIYNLYYNDAQNITASEAHNHAAMNTSFGKSGLSANAYNAKYARLKDRMQMSLYATSAEIDSTALRYFFVETDYEKKPNTIEEYKAIFEKKGLNCKETQQN